MAVEGITLASVGSQVAGNAPEKFIASIDYSEDQLIVASLGASPSDSVSLNEGVLTKSLVVTGDEIIYKLNQLLKDNLPDGIESLKPEDTTPEATATRVVDGIALLFEAYQRQNPQLDADQLIKEFMEQARKGVDAGYNDAFEVLKGLGAFDYEGVQSGVEKTKALIEEKLKVFEKQKREQLGLESTVEPSVASAVSNEVLTQAAGSLSVIA